MRGRQWPRRIRLQFLFPPNAGGSIGNMLKVLDSGLGSIKHIYICSSALFRKGFTQAKFDA